MIPPAGLRAQTNTWSCGPCALRHAMLCYGVRVSWKRIAALAGIDRDFFSDENADTTAGLARAATELGFAMALSRRYASTGVAITLRNFATIRPHPIPVLVCVDEEEHWIVVASCNKRLVTILDSSRPGPVLRRVTWDVFLRRANMGGLDSPHFDLYPVRDARIRKDGRLLSDSEVP